MTEIIAFPQHKIVREVPVNHEILQQAKEKGLTNFADQITDSLVENMMLDLDNSGIDTDAETFLRDMSLAVDSLRAAVYRHFGISHHLHSFIDKNVLIVRRGEAKELQEQHDEENAETEESEEA